MRIASILSVGFMFLFAQPLSVNLTSARPHRATVGSTEMRMFTTGITKDALREAKEPVGRDVVEVAASGVRTPCTVQPQIPRPVGQSNTKKKYLSPAVVPPCAPSGGPTKG